MVLDFDSKSLISKIQLGSKLNALSKAFCAIYNSEQVLYIDDLLHF